MLEFILFFSVTPIKKIEVQKTNIPPIIDGIISEGEWQDNTAICDFVQWRPFPHCSTSQRTYVFLLYDKTFLYIAFKCLDANPSKLNIKIFHRGQS